MRAATHDDEWVYPRHHKHQQYISELMSCKHLLEEHPRIVEPYQRNQEFTKEELLEITPSDVARYLLYKAFENPFPHDEDRPIAARACSLKKAKSGISWFMPHGPVPWMEGRGGNPNHSKKVRDVIKRVEECEVKGIGVCPNDKRAYNNEEVKEMLAILRSCTDFDHRIKYPTMTIWAYTLIHRVDDTCNFKMDAPHGNVEFPHSLKTKTKTKWSKNARTNRNCPDQILLASDDWNFCVILWLAIYLEDYLQKYPNSLFLWTESRNEEKGPDNIKKRLGNRVKAVVWNNEHFQSLKDNTGDDTDKGLGTYSLRKFAATRASRRGGTDQQVEYRGRWIGEAGGRVVRKHYITPKDDYTDALIASYLCVGGPIRHALQDGLNVTDNFLFSEVAPNIRARFSQDYRLCKCLGLAYMWAVFDEDASAFINPVDRDRIRTQFGRQCTCATNPIKKVRLHIVKGVNDKLDIVDMAANATGTGTAAAAGGVAAAQATQDDGVVTNAQLMAHLQRMEQRQEEHITQRNAEMAELKTYLNKKIDLLIQNQKRFGGTIGNAFARQHPDRNANIQNHQDRERQQHHGGTNRAAVRGGGARGRGRSNRGNRGGRGNRDRGGRASVRGGGAGRGTGAEGSAVHSVTSLMTDP